MQGRCSRIACLSMQPEKLAEQFAVRFISQRRSTCHENSHPKQQDSSKHSMSMFPSRFRLIYMLATDSRSDLSHFFLIQKRQRILWLFQQMFDASKDTTLPKQSYFRILMKTLRIFDRQLLSLGHQDRSKQQLSSNSLGACCFRPTVTRKCFGPSLVEHLVLR